MSRANPNEYTAPCPSRKPHPAAKRWPDRLGRERNKGFGRWSEPPGQRCPAGEEPPEERQDHPDNAHRLAPVLGRKAEILRRRHAPGNDRKCFRINEDEIFGRDNHDFTYQAATWDKARGVVAKVEWHKGELFPRIGFIVTNMGGGAAGVVFFYNGKGGAEQWIKEGKLALNWTRVSCHDFVDNQVRLQLFALAYNLGNFLRRLALPHGVKHWSLTTLREKLIKIGAKVIQHARYVVFQMAEVAIPRGLFRAILDEDSTAEAGPSGAEMTTGGCEIEGGAGAPRRGSAWIRSRGPRSPVSGPGKRQNPRLRDWKRLAG